MYDQGGELEEPAHWWYVAVSGVLCPRVRGQSQHRAVEMDGRLRFRHWLCQSRWQLQPSSGGRLDTTGSDRHEKQAVGQT